jgi:hypothetical protein
MSYGTDLDAEYDDPNGDLEVEIESRDSDRSVFDGRLRQRLEGMEPAHVLDMFGR